MQWLVEADARTLKKLAKASKQSEINSPRGVFEIVRIPPDLRKKVHVFRCYDEWNQQASDWYLRGLHEVLTDVGLEYYESPNVHHATRSKAEREWARINEQKLLLERTLRELLDEYRAKRKELEATLEETLEQLRLATELVIRTQGPEGIEVNGVPYKASVNRPGTRVFLIPIPTT